MKNGFVPQTLTEALAIRRREQVTPYGGGTDLMAEHHRAGTYLFLHRVPELTRITEDDTYLRLGACCTFTQVVNHPATPAILKEAISRIAAPAIRNLGTVGGNIGNGSAKADSVLIFFALDAKLRLMNADGERILPIRAFYKGRKELDLAEDELIVEVLLPRQMPERYIYHKVGARAALAISRLSFAGLWSVEDGKLTACATAFGAIEQMVVRLPEVDEILIGVPVAQLHRVRSQYLQAYSAKLNPIDGRISALYRKSVCLNLLEDFLDQIQSAE
ncbi:MAG: FAD binding domain-containing protein [Oscillospiraceae bacterium]|nr:FAD binding domain-containing protein [Oscillospiraceae bacterium]